MKKVTLTFVGHGSDDVAKRFYSWMVDGGLEDLVIDHLSTREVEVEGIDDFDGETLDVAIRSKPADDPA